MAASPKNVRKTSKRTELELVNIPSYCMSTKKNKMGNCSYCTRKRGEDIDEHGDADSADDSQHHIIVKGVSDFIIKQLRPSIQHFHFTVKGDAK